MSTITYHCTPNSHTYKGSRFELFMLGKFQFFFQVFRKFFKLFPVLVCSRLGVIEEEREEDERKLSVAVAAAERMNVLVRKQRRDDFCSLWLKNLFGTVVSCTFFYGHAARGSL